MPVSTPSAMRIRARVRDLEADLVGLSHHLHEHPEVGMAEFGAVAAIRGLLEKHGYTGNYAVGGLATAFRVGVGAEGPKIAVLAVYDALPSIGHACGHNVICAAAVGAFLGIAAEVSRLGGSVILVGTPAEENFAGKIDLINAGAFDDVDAAVMVHPCAGTDAEVFSTLGVRTVNVTFRGVSSHASADPAAGRNALDATVFAYQGIAALRQHIPDSARLHGVVIDGGAAANVVPDHSSASYLVRADSSETLEHLSRRVEDIFNGAALMSGTTVITEWDSVPTLLPIKDNHQLLGRYTKHMTDLGRPMRRGSRTDGAGSTDFGNVSQRMPGIHPGLRIAPAGTALHCAEFAAAAASPDADEAIIDASIALALTMADYLSDAQLRRDTHAEFDEG
jgi:amidohydrolase